MNDAESIYLALVEFVGTLGIQPDYIADEALGEAAQALSTVLV